MTLCPWSSLVEGGEGTCLPNCQTNLVIALYTLSLLFRKFINTTASHLGRYEPSPSTKELHTNIIQDFLVRCLQMAAQKRVTCQIVQLKAEIQIPKIRLFQQKINSNMNFRINLYSDEFEKMIFWKYLKCSLKVLSITMAR